MKTNTGKGIDWPFDYETLEPYYWHHIKYLYDRQLWLINQFHSHYFLNVLKIEAVLTR